MATELHSTNTNCVPWQVRLPSLAMELLGGATHNQVSLYGGAKLSLQRLASDIIVTVTPSSRGNNQTLAQLAEELKRRDIKALSAGDQQRQNLSHQLVRLMSMAVSDEVKWCSYLSPSGMPVTLHMLDGGAVVMTVERPWGRTRTKRSTAPKVDKTGATAPMTKQDSIDHRPSCMIRGLAMASV